MLSNEKSRFDPNVITDIRHRELIDNEILKRYDKESVNTLILSVKMNSEICIIVHLVKFLVGYANINFYL